MSVVSAIGQRFYAKVLGTLLLGALVLVGGLLFSSTSALAYSYDSEEIAFVKLINQYRADNGLSQLKISDAISEAAYRHNSDMGKYGFFDHYTVKSDWFAKGTSPYERMAKSGYNYNNTYEGENIAAGYVTAADVFKAWKNSPGHNANMLNPHYKVIGISRLYVSTSKYIYFWTTDFGGYVDASAHSVDTSDNAVSNSEASGSEAPGKFKDLNTSSLYYQAIITLESKGVINGFSDGSFGSDKPVTRQQFAKMIVLALGYPVTDSISPFKDVEKGKPYPSSYVAVCAEKGITLGKTATKFDPTANITRAQLITMIVRATAGNLNAPSVATPFKKFDDTHYGNAQIAYSNGLLNGIKGMGANYNFAAPASRGEVCQILYNYLSR